jgi:mRNA interferase RelE/StbE
VAAYSLRIKRSAAKELDDVEPRALRNRIVSRVQALAHLPRPLGCEKLAAADARFRIRVGDYRILYEIDDLRRAIDVVKIGHRSDVYR